MVTRSESREPLIVWQFFSVCLSLPLPPSGNPFTADAASLSFFFFLPKDLLVICVS